MVTLPKPSSQDTMATHLQRCPRQGSQWSFSAGVTQPLEGTPEICGCNLYHNDGRGLWAFSGGGHSTVSQNTQVKT